MVEAYCDYYNTEGIIVYDGNQKRRAIEEGNPMVIFSKSGEDADTVIEGLVYKLDDKARARVVTDDRVITNMVTGMGAFTMGALLFETEARHAIESIRESINDE
jgi:predicted RNA-binding protein with PIN domain